MLLRHFSIGVALLLSFGLAISPAESGSLRPQTPSQSNSSAKLPNLSAEQAKKIGETRHRYRDQIAQRTQELRKAQQELTNLLKGTATEKEVRDKYRQVSALRQQIEDLRFDSMMAVRTLLTPEQRRQFSEYMQQQRENYRNRMTNGTQPKR